MLTPPPFALSEILAMERALSFGAPTLTTVVEALERRWAVGLRDAETLVRLAGALFTARVEPSWLIGPGRARLPDLAERLTEFGGSDALDAESAFGIAFLALRGGDLLGSATTRSLLTRTTTPGTTPLLRNARWFTGDHTPAQTDDVMRHRQSVREEIHARFAGRGLYGDTLRRELLSALRRAGRQPRLG